LCLFLFLADGTHILDHVHVISFIFDHFASQLSYVKLFVQPHKCSAWALFGLPLEFVSLVKYYCFQGGIKIIDVPFGSVFFISSFFIRSFMRRCSIWRRDFKIKGHVAFGILFRCFVHKPSFLLHCFLPSKFSESTCF